MEQTVPISDPNQRKYQEQNEEQVFPLILQAKSPIAPQQFLAESGTQLDDLLQKYGVVIIRNLGVKTAEDFSEFVCNLPYDEFEYVGGNAVRTVVAKRVFTANESPPSESIPFHHELAQAPLSPGHLAFWCEIAPKLAGETSILRSDKVYEALSRALPEFMQELIQKGVRYVRVLPPEDDPLSAIGRSWKKTYWSEDKQEIEKKLRLDGYDFEWLPNDCLKTTSPVLIPIREDKRNGKKVFFNQMIAAYTGWKDSRNDPAKALILGNGDPIDPKIMGQVVQILEEHRTNIPWQQNDIMLVDNMLAMHARMPFEPPRRILASLMK